MNSPLIEFLQDMILIKENQTLSSVLNNIDGMESDRAQYTVENADKHKLIDFHTVPEAENIEPDGHLAE